MPASETPLILSVDCGATWTKAAILEIGDPPCIRAVAATGGTNPNVSGTDLARTRLSQLVTQILSVVDGNVLAVCVGAAGTPVLAAAIAEEHLTGVPAVLPSDASLPAYSCPSWRTRNVVSVVAGTGSMAVRIPPGSISPTSTAGGWGWFLGDDAGGVGIGRDVARAVLNDLQGGPETLLTQIVADHLGSGTGNELTARIYENFYGAPGPQEAASTLAPLLMRAVQERDPVATRIRDRAVTVLVGYARALARPGDHVTAAGSVALALEGELRPALEEMLGHQNVRFVADGVAGGAAAAADLIGFDLNADAIGDNWEAAREHLGSRPSEGGSSLIVKRIH